MSGRASEKITVNRMISRNWQIRAELETKHSDRLATELGISGLTARVMALRGIEDPAEGKLFLEAQLASLPDPDLLPDMPIACGRLAAALRNGEKIFVHGDYDVDGISACALMVDVLRQLGAEVTYHIPLRMKDGYGLSANAVRVAQERGCSLLVSVDCGVTAHAEAELAAELGLDLIITDHHQPPERLPSALALVNPHLPGNRFPWKDLAGVGVAFFVLAGLRRRLREDGFFAGKPEPDLRQGLDLVALGTIADIVPLGGVNRTLVRSGLRLLEQGQRPGVAALKKVADVKTMSSGVVGFRLAPRLNAAGRLEDAALGVELLLASDRSQVDGLATTLDGFNRERQSIEQQTLEEALAMVEGRSLQEQYSLVLASENWHPGVIGIVASRLVERYHRPTVLISLENGKGKGSARSISGFHLYRALDACAAILAGYGGHAMAAGLSLDESAVQGFAEAFETVARERLSAEDLIPVLWHDGDVEFADLDLEQLEELERLNPFGAGNPQPAFVSTGCRVLDTRILADKHLKFSAEQNGRQIDCIAFGQAERFEQLNGRVDLLYRPEINQWRGHVSPQLQIIDFRSSRV